MERAAKEIGDSCGCAVLLKGGHSINDANDLLYHDGTFTWLTGKRIDNPNTHGTGCTLSSAIASGLAKGLSLPDAIAAAKSRNADVLICDTAGRLHNKKNLMAELHKIHTIIEKEYPEALLETMIVVDGTTGQNALAQAKEFSEVADVSGVILTKLDGTAKGGIAIAIQSELSIPVKYIGIGEQIGDLQRFDAEEFVNALFEE